jgi:thiamine-phosphate pyrophosphorylase
MEGAPSFLLAVITAPDFFPGEAACLQELLAAGLEKLHLRKPGGSKEEMEALLGQIAPCWYSRLVLHGRGRELVRLAARYGIPQIHCPLKDLVRPDAGLPGPEFAGLHTVWPVPRITGQETEIAVSASLHGWSAIKEIEKAGLAYVFMSPVFHSLSKPGYAANPLLRHRPADTLPCKVIGLGGVDKDTLGLLIREGWEGAAVLGYIWENPRDAVKRYEQLRKVIEDNCP